MKMIRWLMASLIIIFLFGGCNKAVTEIGEKTADVCYQLADLKEWEGLKDNSPEKLAVRSNEVYQEMLDGTITPEAGFDAAILMATNAAAAQMAGDKSAFVQGIRATIESLRNNDNDRIKAFHYSECIEDKEYDGRFIIFRIQEMESGKLYYFKQDFIKEDETYKIYGNNVENAFRLVSKK